MIHTFAERIGKKEEGGEKEWKEFSLTVFHTQRVNNLQ
jgi:hypothetical protein